MITIEALLYEGSPFLPQVNQEVINLILADVRQDSLRLPGELIAIRLCQVAETQAAMILAEGEIVELHERFGTMHTDIGPHLLGFTRPLLFLRGAFTAACEGFSRARSLLDEADLSFEAKSSFLENLEYAVGLLRQDPSGRLLISTFVTREAGSNRNIYYRVGLEVARRTFTAYSDIIDSILRDMGYRAPLLPAQKPWPEINGDLG